MDKGKAPMMTNVTTEEKRAMAEMSEYMQREKGDCITHGTAIQLAPVGKCDFEPNSVTVLRDIWFKMMRHADFNEKYIDIAHLLFIPLYTQMLKAMLHFWDPSYHCFTFRQFDLAPTIEEYAKLLNRENLPEDKVYCCDQKRTPKGTLSRLIGIHASELESHIRMEGQNLDSGFFTVICSKSH